MKAHDEPNTTAGWLLLELAGHAADALASGDMHGADRWADLAFRVRANDDFIDVDRASSSASDRTRRQD